VHRPDEEIHHGLIHFERNEKSVWDVVIHRHKGVAQVQGGTVNRAAATSAKFKQVLCVQKDKVGRAEFDQNSISYQSPVSCAASNWLFALTVVTTSYARRRQTQSVGIFHRKTKRKKVFFSLR
jgi:hypothetical protein